ncbi:MAG TPA: hypothetical protein VKZ60_19185 [Chloroflexota bacterium]|nr:hypothetical protein [Chloroflexota bacterium]
MGWCGPGLRRQFPLVAGLLLALSTVLGPSGRVVAGPAPDEQARDWLERTTSAMSQPGRVFRAQQTVRDRVEAGELTSEFTVWIDAEQRKGRLEVRRDNNLVTALVVDGWDVATYDAVLNKVNKVTVREEVRDRVRNPAFSVLAPSLIAAYMAGEVNPVDEVTANPNDQFNGNPAVKLTFSRRETVERPVQQPGQQQGQPQTETVTLQQEYTLYLDPNTNLPLQETVRGTEVNGGRELSVRTVTYNRTELLDRSAVDSSLLTLQSVESLQAGLDQQLDRARRIGFPLYWLGRELPLQRGFTDIRGQRQNSLVLNDVVVADLPDQPRQVLLAYGTRDDPSTPYVVIIQQPRADWERFLRDFRQQAGVPFWTQLDGVQRSPVNVQGAQATLYQLQPPQPPSGGQGGAGGRLPQLPPFLMVQVQTDASVTNVNTMPLFNNDGQQVNPFHDPQQITALAQALSRLN